MRTIKGFKWLLFSIPMLTISIVIVSLFAEDSPRTPAPAEKSSYLPVVDKESFSTVRNRMSEAKPGIMKRQMDLLAQRYDLSNRPAKGAVMDRSKPLQEGVRVKLPAGVTWAQLADMTSDQIRDKNLFPQGFLPLPPCQPP
jgi:cytochrome c peroxidase